MAAVVPRPLQFEASATRGPGRCNPSPEPHKAPEQARPVSHGPGALHPILHASARFSLALQLPLPSRSFFRPTTTRAQAAKIAASEKGTASQSNTPPEGRHRNRAGLVERGKMVGLSQGQRNALKTTREPRSQIGPQWGRGEKPSLLRAHPSVFPLSSLTC